MEVSGRKRVAYPGAALRGDYALRENCYTSGPYGHGKIARSKQLSTQLAGEALEAEKEPSERINDGTIERSCRGPLIEAFGTTAISPEIIVPDILPVGHLPRIFIPGKESPNQENCDWNPDEGAWSSTGIFAKDDSTDYCNRNLQDKKRFIKHSHCQTPLQEFEKPSECHAYRHCKDHRDVGAQKDLC